MKAVVLSLPQKMENITPGDIGAMAQLVASFLENMAEQMGKQGAQEGIVRVMQTLTMYFMNQSARNAIMSVANEDEKKWYEGMEKLMMEVVNTPDHELSPLEPIPQSGEMKN